MCVCLSTGVSFSNSGYYDCGYVSWELEFMAGVVVNMTLVSIM